MNAVVAGAVSSAAVSTAKSARGSPNTPDAGSGHGFSAVLAKAVAVVGTLPPADVEASADAPVADRPGEAAPPARPGGKIRAGHAAPTNPLAAIAADVASTAIVVPPGGAKAEPEQAAAISSPGSIPRTGGPAPVPIPVGAIGKSETPPEPVAPTPEPAAAALHPAPAELPVANAQAAPLALPAADERAIATMIDANPSPPADAPLIELHSDKNATASPVGSPAVAAPQAEPASNPTPAAQPKPTPAVEQVANQVGTHLDQLRQMGRVELQLDLHPPELGRVQLHLALEDGKVNVHMTVQDENTKRLIDQQMEPLRVRFSEMGVSVGQFDVRRDGSSSHPDKQPAPEPSAQSAQADKNGAARLQKTYALRGNSHALVDVLA